MLWASQRSLRVWGREFGTIAKDAGKDKCGIGGNPATVVDFRLRGNDEEEVERVAFFGGQAAAR